MTALSIPLLSLLAGVSFYAGVHHLFIGLRRRVLGTDIMFAVMALAIAGVDITMLLMYQASDLGWYLVALKLHLVLHAVAMVALLWIVACYSDYRPSRLLAGLTAITLAVVVGVLMHPYGMLFVSEPELTRRQLPWGEQVWTAVGPLHPYLKLDTVIFFAFVATMGYAWYRLFRSHRRRSLVIAVGLGFFLAPNVYEVFFHSTRMNTLPLDEISFLGLILVMSFALSEDMLEVSAVKRVLKRTEAQYRHLVENLRGEYFLFEHSLDGIFTYVSPSVEDLLGYSQGEFLRHYADFFTDDPVNETAMLQTELSMRGERRPAYKLEVRHKDGSPRQLEVTEAAVADDEGVVVAVEGIAHDVTERERVLSELRTSERRLAEAQSVASLGSWEWHVPTGATSWSDELFRLFGLEPQELEVTDDLFLAMIHPEDRVMLVDARDRALATGEAFSEEFRIVRQDGRTLDVQSRAEIVSEDGEPLRMSGTLQDVTDLKAIEERFQALVDSAPVGIIVVEADEGGTIVSVNDQARTMLGYDPDELLGVSVDRLIPSRLVERHSDDRRAFGADPSSKRMGEGREVCVLRKDGVELPVEIGLGSMHTSSGRFVSVVLNDLSERRRATEALQNAQKLESLGVLAGGIAHDFNNLLVGIMGNADLAAHELASDSPASDFVRSIGQSAERAALLTSQLLAYARKGPFELKLVDLNEVVEDLAPMLAAVIPKGVIVRNELSASRLDIECDPSQVTQVVMNLLTNAAEAMGSTGGEVLLATETVKVDSAYLASADLGQSVAPGAYVYVEVTDTGVGIDADTRQKMFDPFFTTKFTGRGLGLAAVLGIVSRHQGGIEIQSQVGVGTRIRVLLPRARSAAVFADAVVLEKEGSSPEGDWAGGTVLVIEDEERVRDVTRRILERAGFDVMLAKDGVDGVECFAEHAADIDMIILDLTMPRMGGEEAFRALRQIDGDVPILVASGYSEEDASGRFSDASSVSFLHKPFRAEVLIDSVRHAIRSAS